MIFPTSFPLPKYIELYLNQFRGLGKTRLRYFQKRHPLTCYLHLLNDSLTAFSHLQGGPTVSTVEIHVCECHEVTKQETMIYWDFTLCGKAFGNVLYPSTGTCCFRPRKSL